MSKIQETRERIESLLSTLDSLDEALSDDAKWKQEQRLIYLDDVEDLQRHRKAIEGGQGVNLANAMVGGFKEFSETPEEREKAIKLKEKHLALYERDVKAREKQAEAIMSIAITLSRK